MSWGEVHFEEEVREWLMSLSIREQGKVSRNIARLGEIGPLHGFPFTSQLKGKLRELRFHLTSGEYRISYYINTDRKIILLTVFRKTKRNESSEVNRAINTYNSHILRNLK